MRILPLAIYDAVVRPDEKELTEKVYYLSSITHGHEISLLGCRIYCDLYTELLKGKTIRDACAALQPQVYERYYDCLDCYRRILDGSIPDADEDDVRSSGYVVDSLEAAVWCLANSSSYEECVLRAVNLGKDTDTIAAIAGSLAPQIFGAESIPKKWSERLLRADMINEMANEYLKVVLKIKEGREGK
jgi:ADP-ribosylglycohydrolase